MRLEDEDTVRSLYFLSSEQELEKRSVSRLIYDEDCMKRAFKPL